MKLKSKNLSAELIAASPDDQQLVKGEREYTEKQEVAFDEVTGFYGSKDRQGASHAQREMFSKSNTNEAAAASPVPENKSEGRTDRSFYK